MSTRNKSVSFLHTSPRKPLEVSKSSGDIPGDPSSDRVFDEAEAARLEALAKPFLAESVDGLPQKLEQIIADYHSSNAQMLIQNADKLAIADASVINVLSELHTCMQRAQAAQNKEKEVADKLRAIDTSKESDNIMTANRRQVYSLMSDMIKRAQIDSAWLFPLNSVDFYDTSSISSIFSAITNITNEIKTNTCPEGLEDMPALIEERNAKLQELSSTFASDFLEFFFDLLKSPQKVQQLAAKNPKVNGRPTNEIGGKAVPFSHDVSEHVLLRAIYPYWKFILWIKTNNPDAFNQMIFSNRGYFHSAVRRIDEQLKPMLEEQERKVQSFKRAKPQEVLFSAGDTLKLSDGKAISAIYNDVSKQIFTLVNIEGTILTEFFGVKERSQFSGALSEDLVAAIEATWTAAGKYDQYFLIRAHVITVNQMMQSLLPIDPLLQRTQKLFQSFIDRQTKAIAGLHVSARKTVILPPFNDLPNFIQNIYYEGPDPVLDGLVITLVDKLMKWLDNEVSVKFSKHKRVRLLIINLFAILSKCNMDIINQSPILQGKFAQLEETQAKQIEAYLQWLTSKAWKHATEFFGQIHRWRDEAGLTYEMISFQPSHTEDKYLEMIKELEKKLQASVNECFALIAKKIHIEQLKMPIKKNLIEYVDHMFHEWSDIAMECYNRDLNAIADKVKSLLVSHP